MNNYLVKEIKKLGFKTKDYEDKIFDFSKDQKVLLLTIKQNSISIQISNNGLATYLDSFDYNQISQSQIITNIKYLYDTLHNSYH